MANKIGIVLALDGEQKFTQGMKNAQQSAKLLDGSLKELEAEYKGNANSLDALSQKQEVLKQRQDAYQRVLTAAKTGQANAKKAYIEQAEAVERLQKEYDKAKDALSKMDKAADADAFDKQEKEVQKLSTALDKQTANYLKAENRLTSWDNKVDKAKTSINKNSDALQKNEKYMNEAANSADKCATSIDKMGKEASEAASKTGKMGDGLKTALAVAGGNIAAQAMSKIASAAADAAKYVVEVGSSFEKAMSEVEAISGAAGSELDEMSQKAKELGSTTKFSATEVAEGFKYMSLAEWNTSQMLTSIGGIVNLAAAAEMDLAEASDMVTDYLSAFGLSADYAGKMADEMAYAQANSNTTVTMLGESFSNCAADMHAAGQDMETTTSILEAMANQGTKGAEAGTALSAMMRDISQKMKDGKIQIGDTAVAVQDSEGNFRDLTDVLKDVEKATNGMGTAEKRVALQKTFTARSMKAVNEVLTEGVDKVEQYENALRNSDGAAAKMADTMQDNLQGAVTEFKSATEGLGIAAYDLVKGPLTGAVDLATGAISGLTKVIGTTPQELSPLEQYIVTLKEINTVAEEAARSASETMNNAATDAGTIQTLGARLMELNGVEELTVSQRGEMRTIVTDLKEYIPELAKAYDEETGSLKLTNEQLADYINNSKTALINSAAEKARSEVAQSMFEVQSELNKAAEATQAADEKARDMNTTYGDLKAAAEEYAEAQADAMSGVGVDEEKREKALAAVEEIRQKFKDAGVDLANYENDAGQALLAYVGMLENAENTWSDAAAEEQRLNDNMADLQGQMDEIDQTAKSLIETTEKETKTAKEAADATVQSEKQKKQARIDAAKAAKESGHEAILSQQALDELAESEKEEMRESVELAAKLQSGLVPIGRAAEAGARAVKQAGEEAEDTIDGLVDTVEDAGDDIAKKIEWTADQQAEAVKNAAENSKTAITDAWQSMKDTASGTLKFSISSEFDGGDDLTTEKMNANLDSQIRGYEKYAENLAKMREYVAQGIISPEFFSNLEQQGTAAANEIDHMVWTVENQGEYGAEQVKGISDKWTEALDMQDQISSIIAGDQAALTDALRSLGSTDAEFDALKDAVSSGLDGADKEMQSKIQGLVDTAQQMGAKIPDGLTEAISNSDISADQIEEQLNAAINGTLDGLLEIAQEQGAKVDDELAASIADGSADVQDAYDQLIASISSNVSASGAIKDAGKEAFTQPLATSIQENQGEVVEAVSEMAEAAAGAAQEASPQFQSAGKESADQYAQGIKSEQGQVDSAGRDIGSAGYQAAASYIPSWHDIGVYMGQGVSQGLREQVLAVAQEAANMVRRAMDAAKAEADIHSPSRKWRDQVGKMMGKGQALGIALSAKDNENAAKTMVEKTIIAATKAAKKAKTAADKDYLWNAVTSKAITANFGIKRTTKKSGKTTKKTDDAYYSQIYSAAQNYFEQLSLKQDQSTKSELAYWKAVQKRLKSGTKAYAQAAAQIQSLKDSMGTYSVASDLLSEWETYFDMSALAEEQYWDRVRKKYKQGTEDRAKADQKYLEAKKARNEKLKALEDDLTKKTQDATDKYNDALQSRIDTLKSAFDLFDAFESESASGEQLLFNMQSQAEGYQYWREQVDALHKRGILSDGLMEELEQRGPSDTASIVALNTLDDKQLRQYNDAYLKKMDQVQAQATKESQKDAKERDDAIAAATKEYKDALAEVNTNLDSRLISMVSDLKNIASDEVDKLIQAIAYGSAGSSEAKASAPGVSGALAPSAKITAASSSTSTSTSAAKSEKEKIKDIINSGTARSKKITAAEKKAHHALWEYLATKYGRNGTNSMYKQLASALGIKASDKVTSAQKTKILNALKKKGLRSGTKRLEDVYAWMDEMGLGSEMIVRQSDGARLNTSVQPGDAIVPAKNTDNLWEWSKIVPSDFERQLAAVQAYVSEMTASVASMSSLNARVLGAAPPQIGVPTTPAAQGTNQMISLLQQMVSLLQDGHDIYLDSGELVGGTAGKMSTEFARRQRRRR